MNHQDPYTKEDVCINRLLSEYNIHKKLIIAVDFDDTVFDYHNAGHKYDRVLLALRRCQELGFYIVLFTGSHPDNWNLQRKYLEERGIIVHEVNKNPVPLPFGNHGKIYYNLLLDDRAGLGQALQILEQTINRIHRVEELTKTR